MGEGFGLILATVLTINSTLNVEPNTNIMIAQPTTSTGQEAVPGHDELNGKHFRIGVLEVPPYIAFTKVDGKIVDVTGIDLDIINIMQNKYNFTYEIVIPSIMNIPGARVASNVQVQTLLDQGVDIIARLRLNSKFEETLKLMDITNDDFMCISVMWKKNSELEDIAKESFISTDNIFWFLLLSLSLAFGLVIAGFASLQRWLMPEKAHKAQGINVAASLWFTISCCVNQSQLVNLMSLACPTIKILGVGWRLFLLFMLNIYVATTIFNITLQSNKTKFQAISDLKNYKWMALHQITLDNIILEFSDELYFLKDMMKRGYGELRENATTETYLEHLDAGDVIFGNQMELGSLMRRLHVHLKQNGATIEERCLYQLITFPHTNREHTSLAFTKMTKYLKKFMYTFKFISKDQGIYNYLSQRLRMKRSLCRTDQSRNYASERPRGLQDLSLAYLRLLIGIVPSVLVFITEVLVNKKAKHRDSNNANDMNVCLALEEGSSDSDDELHVKWKPPLDEDVSSVYRKTINGREYDVIIKTNGEVRLKPHRCLSALLFQAKSNTSLVSE